MMAQLTGAAEIPGNDDITVCDPACGSSRCLIAHSRVNPNNRLRSFYVGKDLDYTCVMMSVLNYFVHGMKGVVIHMNTLLMEIYRGYRIFLADTGMGIRPMSKHECIHFLTKQQIESDQEPVEEMVPVVPETLPLTLELDDNQPPVLEKKPVVKVKKPIIQKYVQGSLFDDL